MVSNLSTYTDIFERRGAEHAEAFLRYADSIREEVGTLLELADLATGSVVLDVPSASGFLAPYLRPQGVRLIAIDPSPAMHGRCRLVVAESHCAPMHALPLADASVDVVLCLAGLHHEPQLGTVIAELARVLRPGGHLVIAEVESGSAPATFLNGFVDAHSSTGHEGWFFDERYRQAIAAAGLAVTVDRFAEYHWCYDSLTDMADALRLMFGIDLATPAQIIAAVQATLGTDALPPAPQRMAARVGMRWGLRQVRCEKPYAPQRGTSGSPIAGGRT